MHYDLLIPGLAGLTVIAVGGAILLSRVARRAPLKARLREVQSGTAGGAAVVQATPGIAQALGGFGNIVSSGKSSAILREQLAQAGYHHPAASSIYIGTKAAMFLFGLSLCAPLALFMHASNGIRAFVIAAGAIVLFFIPNIVVQLHRSRRKTEVRTHLPDAIDLLEICASAGMGLDMAWNMVGEEVRNVSPILADEMALTTLEIHLGASRADGMRHMANRTGAEELSSLVAILVQSERFGTSIIESLRVFATSMRETRSQNAQEAAEKMAVKLIFPMILFIFPVVVCVMAGPAILSLQKSFAK